MKWRDIDMNTKRASRLIDADLLPRVKTRKDAITAKCIQCSDYTWNEVVNCRCDDCALYPFRLGKDPFRKPPSDRQREASRERIKNLHSRKNHE